MESRILDACRDELIRQIAPRAQILDVWTFGPHRCDLLLERSGEAGGRARLVVDLSPAHPCLYLTRPAALTPTNEPLRRILVGKWVTGVDRPTPGPILRLLLSPQGGGDVDSWLVFEWLGGSPAALVVDASSREVLSALGEAKGPSRARRERGASYHWPGSPHKPSYDRATADQIESFFDNLAAGGPRPDPRAQPLRAAGVSRPRGGLSWRRQPVRDRRRPSGDRRGTILARLLCGRRSAGGRGPRSS